MKNLFKYHTGYYITLGVLMFLCLTLLIKSYQIPEYRIIIIFMTAFLYTFWGIAHHVIDHDISLKVVLEYILIASLGIILMLFVIN